MASEHLRRSRAAFLSAFFHLSPQFTIKPPVYCADVDSDQFSAWPSRLNRAWHAILQINGQMSALGQKGDMATAFGRVRFTPDNGHPTFGFVLLSALPMAAILIIVTDYIAATEGAKAWFYWIVRNFVRQQLARLCFAFGIGICSGFPRWRRKSETVSCTARCWR
jgi:hypothetical protein